eukprot:scaffold6781_cov204-Amphora_coffeaeformis.AAC.6
MILPRGVYKPKATSLPNEYSRLASSLYSPATDDDVNTSPSLLRVVVDDMVVGFVGKETNSHKKKNCRCLYLVLYQTPPCRP